MSKCKLSIEFDRPDRRYPAGGEVTGRIRVVVNARCRCDALTLTCSWQTHGRGNKRREAVHVDALFSGEWAEAGEYSYPFSIALPMEPLSYHGHYLNIDWDLEVRADVPSALVPKANEDFLVQVDGDQPPSSRMLAATPEARPKVLTLEPPEPMSSVLGTAGAIIVGVLFTLAGLDLFAFVGLGVGGYFLFIQYRNAAASKRCGPVEVTLDAHPAHLGEALLATVELHPVQAFPLNEVKCILKGQEVVVSGSGTAQKTHTHTFYEVEETRGEGAQLTAGQAPSYGVSFPIKAGAPPSFETTDNEIRWTLEVRVDIPIWPDWLKNWPITVAPAYPTVAPNAIADLEETPQPSEENDGLGTPILHSHLPEVTAGASAESALQVGDAGLESDWLRSEAEQFEVVDDPVSSIPAKPEPAPPTDTPAPPMVQAVTPTDGSAEHELVETSDSPSVAESGPGPAECAPVSDEPLAAFHEAIRLAGRSFSLSAEAQAAFDALAEVPIGLDLEVERISRTYGLQVSGPFENGRTVVATVQGTQAAIALRAPATANDDLDKASAGSVLRVAAVIRDWDSLYDRVNMDARSLTLKA